MDLPAQKKYHHAGLGGTFDRFHKGHEELLTTAINTAEKISIGVTTNEFPSSKKLSSIIEPFETRVSLIKKFFREKEYLQNITIFPLTDIFGPTLSDKSIDCLIITDHTLQGAVNINQERAKRSLSILPIIKANLLKDESGEYISSTRIRLGLIDRVGTYYPKLIENVSIISENQKKQLKKPFGKIIDEDKLKAYVNNLHPTCVSVVGDRSLKTILDLQQTFHCGIFDNHIQRTPSSDVKKNSSFSSYPITKIINPSGMIGREAVRTIKKIVNQPPGLIEVEGEEDLLVIPLVIFQPLESVIIYGQPGEGLVVIHVNEQMKVKVATLLSH